jgi:hypothetical protein
MVAAMAALLVAQGVRAEDQPAGGLNPPKQEGSGSSREFESYDRDIEALKGDILELNTLLFQLQEDLLFPEDSSVVVFLSIEGGNYFSLDSVKLTLDDKMVGGYLYTDREVTALTKGGVQRLYTGNVKSGDHQLTAVFTGTGPNRTDSKRAETVPFTKETGPLFIKLIVRDDPDKKQAEFIYDTWK